MVMTTAQKLIMEGEAKGEARGEVKGKAEMVIKALRTKFSKVPKEIENAVFGMSDSIALESLLEHAIHIPKTGRIWMFLLTEPSA